MHKKWPCAIFLLTKGFKMKLCYYFLVCKAQLMQRRRWFLSYNYCNLSHFSSLCTFCLSIKRSAGCGSQMARQFPFAPSKTRRSNNYKQLSKWIHTNNWQKVNSHYKCLSTPFQKLLFRLTPLSIHISNNVIVKL